MDEPGEEAETAKWIKRQTKKQVIFRIEGDEEVDLTEQLAIKGNLKRQPLGSEKIR